MTSLSTSRSIKRERLHEADPGRRTDDERGHISPPYLRNFFDVLPLGHQAMTDIDEEILEEFLGEAKATLTELEPLVVNLAPEGDNAKALHSIFQQLHAIKSTASFVNLPALGRTATAAENLVDELRHEALDVTPNRVDLICDALDIIQEALEVLAQGQGESSYSEQANELAERLDEETKRSSRSRSEREATASIRAPVEPPELQLPLDSEPAPKTQGTPAVNPESSINAMMMIPDLLEKFCAESEEQITNIELTLLAREQGEATQEMLGEAFRAMHSFKGNCGIMGLSDMESITHNLETTFSLWNDGKIEPHQSQITAILSVLDVLRRALSLLPEGAGLIPQKQQLLDALNMTASQAPPAFETSLAEGPPLAVPNNTNEAPQEAAPSPAQERSSSSIRVDTRKLDELMNLVGELIIAETTVTHNPDLEGYEFENFQKAALNLNRITRQLQDVTMQARMVPIETTFRKMVRLVRDVAGKQSKTVKLITTGEETEVDKSVVETIADPLVHLIRNGVDHGLENSEERKAAGKSPEGQLRLHAHHQGGEVWISLSDDGRGIDPEKVLASALKKGVAKENTNYSRDEILQMIFAPGFSTAATITDISGRGVGMDVVKRNIERVNGRIDVATNLGKGTTFTLRIPLTLAIIEGMLVRVGGSYYTIPLLSIRESVKASRENLTVMSDGQEMLKLRNKHYPVSKLSDLSGGQGVQDLSQGILVLVESEGQQACILVDEVVGQRQTVIKPLPDYLRNLRSLGGCSILHNGDISLILDIDALVRSSQKQAAA